jgi:hypothetical protein
MPRTKDSAGDALYFAWKIGRAGDDAAGEVREALEKGESRKLFRLRSWVVVGCEAQALVTPGASLDQITEAIWVGDSVPTASRWVRRGADCAELTRQMETAPVQEGLARRPEQWPYSSACHR